MSRFLYTKYREAVDQMGAARGALVKQKVGARSAAEKKLPALPCLAFLLGDVSRTPVLTYSSEAPYLSLTSQCTLSGFFEGPEHSLSWVVVLILSSSTLLDSVPDAEGKRMSKLDLTPASSLVGPLRRRHMMKYVLP